MHVNGIRIETPRSDAAAVAVVGNWDNQGDHVRSFVPLDFAQRLEFELQRALADAAALRKQLADLKEWANRSEFKGD